MASDIQLKELKLFISQIEIHLENDNYKEALNTIIKEEIDHEEYKENSSIIKLKAKAYAEMDQLNKSLEILELNNTTKFSNIYNKYLNQYNIENCIPEDINEQKKYEEFSKWINVNNAILNKVKLVFFEKNYRGIIASSTIRAGEIIVKIPSCLQITDKIAKQSSIGSKLQNKLFKFQNDYLIYLTLFCLEESNKKESFWKPYFDIFPNNYNSFPYFFSNQEKIMLQGTQFTDYENREKEWFLESYNKMCSLENDIKRFSLEHYSKLMYIVTSRIFQIGLKDNKSMYLLTPFADMFNYKNSHKNICSWELDETTGHFIVKASEDIERGEEIYLNYGIKSCFDYLYFYGFYDDTNDYVTIQLKMDELKGELITEDKLNFLHLTEKDSLEIILVNDFLHKRRNFRQMTFLRLLLLDKANYVQTEIMKKAINDISTHGISKFKFNHIYSLKNEITMNKQLKRLCIAALNKYKTKIEDDKIALDSLIEDEYIDKNKENILKILIKEKSFLIQLVKMCNTVSTILENNHLVNREEIKTMEKEIFYPYLVELSKQIF